MRGAVCALALTTVLSLGAVGQQPSSTPHKFSPAAQRFQNELNAIESNARANPVRRRSVQINAADVNAWFREGGYKLPKGVQKVTFHSHPDTIVADTTVDFDQLKEGKRNLNPLLSMFSGVHDVEVTADASADQGQGKVNVQSVSIDGVGVPRLALELFVKKYLTPKYPNLGLDDTFAMPDRIDSATVGNDSAILTQK